MNTIRPPKFILALGGGSVIDTAKAITDAIAEGLLRTVKENALILHADPQNRDARAEVMWAGSLSHNDLTGCGNDGGDFMSHQLEHEVGGMPTNFSELGIHPTDAQIEEMADRCLAACGDHTGSAKKLTREDMIEIYHNARDGQN